MIVKGTNKLPRAHIHIAECNHSVTYWNHVNFPRKVRPSKINYSKYPCSHSPETSPTENKLQQVFMLAFHCKVLPLKINYSMYSVLQDQHGSNVSPVVHSQLGTQAPNRLFSCGTRAHFFVQAIYQSRFQHLWFPFQYWNDILNSDITSYPSLGHYGIVPSKFSNTTCPKKS